MTITINRPQALARKRAQRISEAMRPLIDFNTRSEWAMRQHQQGISDFTFGNPHEMPLPGVVNALQTWAQPFNKQWFGYKLSEPGAQAVVARSLRERFGVPFEPQDIAMTTGGFGAIATALKAVTDIGDEVIFSLPAWPLYETMIVEAGLVPVKVAVDDFTFNLDIAAIERAITSRTRVVIVNTPNNPTGKIYSRETLAALASVLEHASQEFGGPIYILSDEPYNRIVFDGKRPVSPVEVYDRTLLAYSYGKVLLSPGERIGYLAMPPTMPDRERLRDDIVAVQIASGWTFPNALLQHALGDLEAASIDIDHLQRKRDRLVNELREIGYDVHAPEGTFYLMPKSPIENEAEFVNALADDDVFVIPGSVFEKPGYFRISLTASDEMIERSLPAFKEAFLYAHAYNFVADMVNDGW